MKTIVTLGETMGLFRAESIGSMAQVSDFRLGIGGAESNVAIALARLGARAKWIGRVGDDNVGVRITRELRAENVDARVIVDPVARTGIMVKERRTPGHSAVIYYRAGSAGSRLQPGDLEGAGIESAGMLHLTGITPALSDSAAATVAAAVSIAKENAVPISFDINHRSALWLGRSAAVTYADIARSADIVFGGLDELAMLAPEASDPTEMALSVASLGPRQVIVKLGAEGCIASIDGLIHKRAAIPLEPVDTVGAGDAFVAGYLFALARGAGAVDRLTMGVKLGAMACLNEGDWEGYPSLDELAMLDTVEPVTR